MDTNSVLEIPEHIALPKAATTDPPLPLSRFANVVGRSYQSLLGYARTGVRMPDGRTVKLRTLASPTGRLFTRRSWVNDFLAETGRR